MPMKKRINKITKKRFAELFGYGERTSFAGWKETPERQARYEWLMASAQMIEAGYSPLEVLGLADKNAILEAEKLELEAAIHEYADKIEALRGLRK